MMSGKLEKVLDESFLGAGDIMLRLGIQGPQTKTAPPSQQLGLAASLATAQVTADAVRTLWNTSVIGNVMLEIFIVVAGTISLSIPVEALRAAQ